MTYRTVIVDDEPPARQRLARLLAVHPEIELVGEAGRGGEAVDVIRSVRPDLAFLDIQLPEFDAFEVLRRVEEPPLAIFATGHDEYALEAFRTSSIDYLLKPVEPEALARAIQKLTRLTRSGRSSLEQRLQDLLARLAPAPALEYLGKMAVRVGERAFLIEMSEVAYFQARDKYVFLYTSAGKEYLVDQTVAELESRLDPRKFVRVHRSTLVNIDHVREIQDWFNGKYRLVLDGAPRAEVIVSKGMAPRLKSLISF
jgi:two-component system LytT family response regulator